MEVSGCFEAGQKTHLREVADKFLGQQAPSFLIIRIDPCVGDI